MNHETAHPDAAATAHAPPAAADHPTHPIGVYLKVWGYLFVLSAMSYAVDYFAVQGVLRWVLILTFMVLKHSPIVVRPSEVTTAAAVKKPGPHSRTVRQTPSQAMLSPSTSPV